MSDFFDGPAWVAPHIVSEGLSGWTWARGLRGVEYVTGAARLSNDTLALMPESDEEGPIYTRRELFPTASEAMQALIARFDRSIARRAAIRNGLAKKLAALKGGVQ